MDVKEVLVSKSFEAKQVLREIREMISDTDTEALDCLKRASQALDASNHHLALEYFELLEQLLEISLYRAKS